MKFTREIPFFFSVPGLLWQILFLFVPLLIIVGTSFFILDATGTYQFSFDNYSAIFVLTHAKILSRSFFIATVTVLTTFLLAYPLAYFVAIRANKWKQLLLFFLMLPFWTNLLILAYSWFFMLERDGIINIILLKLGIISQPLSLAHNMFSVLIVMIYSYLPFMIMPLYSALEKIDKRLWEAAKDLGSSDWDVLFRITVPLTLPAIRTGILLVFVPAFGEFAIPMLLGGDKFLVAGSLVAHYFFIAHDNGKGTALTVIIGLGVLIVFTVFMYIFKRLRQVNHNEVL